MVAVLDTFTVPAVFAQSQDELKAHDRFFNNQSALDAKEMPAYAAGLCLNVARFQQCLDSGKYAAKVKADQEEGQILGVKGTPKFFLGYPDLKDPSKVKAVELLTGAVPLDNFKEAIGNLLNPPMEDTQGESQEIFGAMLEPRT